jgi:hypothetical protein
MSPRRTEEVAPVATTIANVKPGYLVVAGIGVSEAPAVLAQVRSDRRMDAAAWCGKAARGNSVQFVSPKHAALMVSVVTDVPTPTGVPPSLERRT